MKIVRKPASLDLLLGDLVPGNVFVRAVNKLQGGESDAVYMKLGGTSTYNAVRLDTACAVHLNDLTPVEERPNATLVMEGTP